MPGNHPIIDSRLSNEELRGFARTVAEIEWLLLVLVLVYQFVLAPDQEAATALSMASFFFAAFVLTFRYINFYRDETYWKLAIETWVMIAYITWVLAHSGRLDSPLLNLYLLVIITSALTLGKLATLLEMIVIAGCYLWLGMPKRGEFATLTSHVTALVAQLTPLLLVAYITTMLSADIRRALVQIKFLSETDNLTGVFNMRAFAALSDRFFKHAVRYSRPFSILMIDSDSLKTINDTYGHEAGNRLLKMTVQCIQSQLRETDLLARYGGDEFVVLLPETGCEGAIEVANRIRQRIESTPIPTRSDKVKMTVSVGIACYPEHGGSIDAIMEKADQAMYHSKSGGRNRITVFNGS
ncbi:MAG: GGDEF domain-containing protein [Burkholderiales bacterium]